MLDCSYPRKNFKKNLSNFYSLSGCPYNRSEIFGKSVEAKKSNFGEHWLKWTNQTTLHSVFRNYFYDIGCKCTILLRFLHEIQCWAWKKRCICYPVGRQWINDKRNSCELLCRFSLSQDIQLLVSREFCWLLFISSALEKKRYCGKLFPPPQKRAEQKTVP